MVFILKPRENIYFFQTMHERSHAAFQWILIHVKSPWSINYPSRFGDFKTKINYVCIKLSWYMEFPFIVKTYLITIITTAAFQCIVRKV